MPDIIDHVRKNLPRCLSAVTATPIDGEFEERGGRSIAFCITSPAQKACRILGARPVFVGQIDGHTEISRDRYQEFTGIIEKESPDLLLTHWPIDRHRDHRAASLLSLDSWLSLERKFDLYYYEVYSGIQTQNFSPTHYVDITATEPRKKSATYAHESQKPEKLYELHDLMNRFRGTEYRCQYAESFVRHVQGPDHGWRF